MEDYLRAEQRFQEHFDRIARVNAEGWKTVHLVKRPQILIAVAQVLVALAIRLDRTVATATIGRERQALAA